jgi:Zn-dependent protease with chaperone function
METKMINRIHRQAIQKLEDSSMYYLASILKRMSIQEVPTSEIAYVMNSGGATIFVGQGFKKIQSEEQMENVLIHEAMHIPQINAAGELEPYYDFDRDK